jgi:toxin YoeB
LKKPPRSLVFDPAGFEDLAWWVQNDRKKALRVIRLIQETRENPFEGVGKPEPLRHELAGCWSRRIDQEHRLVYEVHEDRIRVLACRYHY